MSYIVEIFMQVYHHIINRGVARDNIFLDEKDKDKFCIN